MNEKIKQLAEQFKMNFSVNGYPQDGIHWDNVDEFAELIVRECASLLPARSDYYRLQVQKNIKEHFGVEE